MEGNRYTLYEGLLDKAGRRKREQVYTVQGTPGQAGEEEEGGSYTLYEGILEKPGRRSKGAGIHCPLDSWTSRRGGGREQVCTVRGNPR